MRTEFQLEPLEARILLSADGVSGAASSPDFAATPQEVILAELSPAEGSFECESIAPIGSTEALPDLETIVNEEAGQIPQPDPSLAPGPESFADQVVYLEFNGASNVIYRGPVEVSEIEISPFRTPEDSIAQREAMIAEILSALEREFAGSGVIFTTDKPDSQPHSTIFIGGRGEAFAEYGSFTGLSEKIDAGNQDRSDNAFVFSEAIKEGPDFVKTLSEVVIHETAHLLGYHHAREINHASDIETTPGLLDHLAFKPQTHVEIAKDVRADLLDDGKLDIAGREYDVHPKILDALTHYPSFYYAGAVGPDAFPDLIYGQSLIHPTDTGIWLQRILDMAWAAQTDPAWSDVERSQIIAFAYGYLTHAAGDALAHTLVNEFTEGVFPAIPDVLSDDADLANALRHFMVEAYIGEVTPGADGNPDRTLLPDGDISDDSSHGIIYDVPTRFVYETLLKPFPGDPAAKADTGYTTLTVDLGANAFRRAAGRFDADYDSSGRAFNGDGFEVGDEIYTFGFNGNNGKFTVTFVDNDEIRVLEPLAAGDGVGSGDEAIVTQGSRGVLLDRFYTLRRTVALAEQAAFTAYQLQYGTAPGGDFTSLLLAYPASPTLQETEELFYAYLNDWREEVDDGIANWSIIGIATSEAIFDSQARRNLQNNEGSNVGIDVDPSRGGFESGIGVLDVMLHVLEDPNQDGDVSDSFTTNHLLPMFGIPQVLADFRTPLNAFSEAIDDNIVGPLRLAFNPLSAAIDAVAEIPKQFVLDYIEKTFGIDVEQFDLLLKLSNKLDVASINVNGHQIPLFKPGDHEKIDRYMGIKGIEHSEVLAQALQENAPDFVTFYSDPTVSVSSNVEFDKTKFAAYFNSVQLAKLLLLMEEPVDGETVGAGQLSQLMTDLTGAPYDWGLLNMHGNHGGNIFTTTLQKPGQLVDYQADVGSSAQVPLDSRPWLELIDGGSWRGDMPTTTTLLYRLSPSISQGALAATSTWTASVTAGQAYRVQVSWLSNVTQRVDDPTINDATNFFTWQDDVPISPATNVTYRIFDGASSTTPIATITNLNQRTFNSDFDDGDVTFDYLESALNVPLQVTITTGILRVEMDNNANGHVIAGPIRIEPVHGGAAQRVQIVRDPETLAESPSGQTLVGSTWVDLNYVAGSGNFPLWESVLLRPAFKILFRDWQNFGLQWPALGDTASADPNQFAPGTFVPDFTIPDLATPFDPPPAVTPPAGIVITVVDNDVRTFTDDTEISLLTGNNSGGRDSLTINAGDNEVRLYGFIGGLGLQNLTINAGRIVVEAGTIIHTRLFSGTDAVTSASTGNSGNIIFNASEILIGDGVIIAAHATSGFVPGDITFTASSTEDLDWTFGISSLVFQGSSAEATIDIGIGTTILARDITLQTNAATLKSAELAVAIDPSDPSGLELQINETELVEVNGLAAAVLSESISQISVRAGASLIASRDILLDADALSEAQVTTSNRYLGITYGSSSPTAKINVAQGASLIAVGDVDLLAAAGNTLVVHTIVPAAGEIVHFSISYGKARTTSTVNLDAGSSVAGVNVTL